MFRLHLDLHVHFIPPMSEHGQGVILTREINLPFVPVEGQRVHSRTFDNCPEPMGFKLEDVVWDIDRQVFLAKTELFEHDFPMPDIPAIIHDFVALGWRLGSYSDAYESVEDEAQDMSSEVEGLPAYSEEDAAYDEGAHLLTWNRRRRKTNRILKALIRHMAETYDNEPSAYAFDVTGRFFTEKEMGDLIAKDPHVRKFRDATYAYEQMSYDEREKWKKRTARYPSLEELVGEVR